MKSKHFIGVGLLLVVALFSFALLNLGVGTDPDNNNSENETEIAENQDESEAEPKLYNGNPDEDLDDEVEVELDNFKETIEEQARKYPETFFLSEPTEEKVIALTFDDGPEHINTPEILDILKEEDIKATFFVLGQNVKQFPDIAQRIVDEGHQIANHSWDHDNFKDLTNEEVLDNQIIPTSEKIEKTTGVYPTIIRPPFGAITDETIEFLGYQGWKLVNWSIDSFDWHYAEDTHEEIVGQVERHYHPGGIVLLHNGVIHKETVEALPEIIELLQEDGYEFKTVDELLF
ncbi:polysaccharide deacetylase family protein [Natroniella sulfidigena]|uniref:polysaccharide deacetylase family protein n=1 Tax=Natroniella sulfidigena TaxID=723921 RepID=UPI00200B81AE|nr:polysaccharide deacetylase family protein [Natroniella sulfidigena]MCK8815778.1 polysaccharide deacetylase family protein [Natroniella sulfidigena]